MLATVGIWFCDTSAVPIFWWACSPFLCCNCHSVQPRCIFPLWYSAFWPFVKLPAASLQAFGASSCKARPYEKQSSCGCFPMAFRFLEACTELYPPYRNIIPDTAAGIIWRKQLKVAFTTSSELDCVEQSFADKIMFGLSRVPSKYTH